MTIFPHFDDLQNNREIQIRSIDEKKLYNAQLEWSRQTKSAIEFDIWELKTDYVLN